MQSWQILHPRFRPGLFLTFPVFSACSAFISIMFYSRSLLCTFCSACHRCCTHKKYNNNNKKKNHFTGRPNDSSIRSDFSLIPFLSHLCLKLQGSAIRWWGQRGRLRSLSRGQTSIFINMPLCLLSENIILDSREGEKTFKHNVNISPMPVSYQRSHKLSKNKDFFFTGRRWQ